MRIHLFSLALITLVACEGRPNRHKVTEAQQSDLIGVLLIDTEGRVAQDAKSKSPAVGVYLAPCEVQAAKGIATGVEITATHVYPVTAIFGDSSCASDTLATWGYTGDYPTFASYAAQLHKDSKAQGDAIAAAYEDTSINFVSKSGIHSSFKKVDVSLFTAKRLRLNLDKVAIDAEAKTVSAILRPANSIFADGEWDAGFYCKKDGKLVRQEATIESLGGGAKSIAAKINTWGQGISFPAECQVSFTARHGEDNSLSTDLAYSPFLTVP